MSSGGSSSMEVQQQKKKMKKKRFILDGAAVTRYEHTKKLCLPLKVPHYFGAAALQVFQVSAAIKKTLRISRKEHV